MQKGLLLSNEFNESELINQIHKYMIFSKDSPSVKEIEKLLPELLYYLDKKLNLNTSEELFLLIKFCFSFHPNKLLPLFTEFLSKINSNRIIIIASILSYLIIERRIKITDDYNSFISTSYNQIINQINKKNNKCFVIFDHEIPLKFEANFVVDIFSLIKYHKKDAILLKNYLNSHPDTSKTKISNMIQNLSPNRIVDSLPNQYFQDTELILKLQPDGLIKFIPNIPDESFKQLLPKFDAKLQEKNRNLIKVILERCIKLDVDITNHNNLIDGISSDDLNPTVWEYLAKYKITLNDELANKVTSFSNPFWAVIVMPNAINFTQKMIDHCLLNATDLYIYDRLLCTFKIKSEVFSYKNFWLHLINVVSKSQESFSKKSVDELSNFLQIYFDSNHFRELFKMMIFNQYPPNKNVNTFLYDLLCAHYHFKFDFNYPQNLDSFFKQVYKTHKIPIPSFWKIVENDRLANYIDQNGSNSILIYAFEFSSDTIRTSIILSLTLSSLDKYATNKISDFIKQNDIDYIVNMNDDALYFIASAFITTNSSHKSNIHGLTKEVFLPFFAIGLIYIDQIKRSNLSFIKESTKMINLLIESCKFFETKRTSLAQASVDRIFSLYQIWTNRYFFDSYLANQIIEIFLSIFIRNNYYADKMIFLKAIFNISFKYDDVQLQKIFNKYGLMFLIYIIKNIDGLINITDLNDLKLNLTDFKASKIFNYFSSEKEIFKAIYFLKNYCINAPIFKIQNPNFLNKIITAKIHEEKWNDALLVGEFMNKYHIEIAIHKNIYKKIPYEIKFQLYGSIYDYEVSDHLYDIVSNLLNNVEPEKNDSYYHLIYQLMMDEQESLARDHIIVLFESLGRYQSFEPYDFIEVFQPEYENYKKAFLQAIVHGFTYNTKEEKLIRKTNYGNIEFKSKREEFMMINFLFEKASDEENLKDRYQSFILLKNIASSFPFLFMFKKRILFNSLLDSLNYFTLYYTIEDNDPNIYQLKVSLAALSFIHSTLYSTAIINAFVSWYLMKIKTFNEPQFLSLSLIFISLFQTEKVKIVLLSLSMKYNLIDGLLERMKLINPHKIKEYYFKTIYSLIDLYFDTLNELSIDEAILVKEMQNVENPFSIYFENFYTILPNKIKKITLPNRKSNSTIAHINDYFKSINSEKSFSISFNFGNRKYKYYSQKDISNFLLKISQLSPNNDNKKYEKFSIPYSNTIEVFRYLFIKQPKWVYKWVVLKKKFPLMKEHYDILIQVKNELEKLNTDENDEYDFSKMEINDYFLEEFCRKELLQNLICYSCILQNEQIIEIIYSAIDSITVNEVAFISVLDIINQFIEHMKDKNSFLSSMKRIIDLLMNMSDDDLFEQHFIDVCGNNLIEKLLYPSLRNDASLLITASSLFCSLNSELPFRIVNLIGFMFFLNNSEIIPYALKLCSKLNVKQMESLLSIIIKAFENEISKTDPSIDIIEAFIEDIPHLFKPKISELKPFIDKIFLKYEQSSFTNNRLSNFICSLMNFLAPEKLEYEFLFPKDSKEIDFSFSYSRTPNMTDKQNKDDELLLQPAPKNLKNMDDFWEIYENHRRALSKIIENNGNMVSKMSFLSYFPELLSFEKRVSHFRKSIRYHSNEFLSIEVDRNKNLFNDSFVQLNNRTYDEWMGKISVDFKGENGIDAGGLTKEWFTLITKEIFDPNQSLFISTENNSYIPKKSPHKLDETEIELYRFVGKIIARALVEGIHVNAHLTPSFCRQILHRQIKLSDMEDYDVNIYNSLISICDTDVEPLNLYFAINYDENGEYKTIPLKENGNNINVTNSNKMEYISLYTNYHLRESICDQLTAFCEGFDFIIHPDDIRFFAPNELDLLICGIPEIDVQDLRENTEYLYPYNKNHPVIKLFFKAIEKWSNEQLAKLIMFFTGSSQVPINGFAEYKKNGKPIQIGPGGDKNKLCTAHTCFNQLCLPEYETENELNYKLAQSIQEFSYGLM